MTKRLTPEEDARVIADLDKSGSRGRLITSHGDDVVIAIDKDAQEMEIWREGERFLEVRFKRKGADRTDDWTAEQWEEFHRERRARLKNLFFDEVGQLVNITIRMDRSGLSINGRPASPEEVSKVLGRFC